MNNPHFSISKAREMDLVDYLESLGHHPQKISGIDYWYLSPIRIEKTASFKVNRKLNVWYDHGIGKGGNFIDFGILYFNCSVRDLLQHLQAHSETITPIFFHPQSPVHNNRPSAQKFSGEGKENGEHKITIVDVRVLQKKSLLEYLQKRCIQVEIASQFCKEVDFKLYGKIRTAIGFKNDAGGYELRCPDFKGSCSPKTSTFIDNGKVVVSVFEGFFNYLTYQTINQKMAAPLTNFLVLNSLAFFEKLKNKMNNHDRVDLYLDRDPAGINVTLQSLKGSEKFIDQSHVYHPHKDLNDWLVQQQKPKQKQRQRLGRHF